jgi:hypothetical protein
MDGHDAPSRPTFAPSVRLAELLAAVSLATDIGTGQPTEHGLRSCLVALRIGQVLGLHERELADVYYVALLAMLGCTANAPADAALFGDELAFGAAAAPVLMGGRGAMFSWLLSRFAADQPPARRAARVARAMLLGPGALAAGTAAHCEVAQLMARRLGFGPGSSTRSARSSSAGTAWVDRAA